MKNLKWINLLAMTLIFLVEVRIAPKPEPETKTTVEEYTEVKENSQTEVKVCITKDNTDKTADLLATDNSGPKYTLISSKEKKDYNIAKSDNDNTFYTYKSNGEKDKRIGFMSGPFSAEIFESIREKVINKIVDNGQNSKRIQGALAGYDDCLQKNKSYYLMDAYSLPLSHFIPNSKIKLNDERISLFHKMGETFKGMLMTMSILHTPKDKKTDSPYYIQSVSLNDIGVYPTENIGLVDIKANQIVVRRTTNIVKSLNTNSINISKLNINLKSHKNLTADQQMLINYLQILNLFIDTVNSNVVDEDLKIEDCFGEVEVSNLFKEVNCPGFMLNAIAALPKDERQAIISVIKSKSIAVNPNHMRSALYHIFNIIEKYEEVYESYNANDHKLDIDEYEKNLKTTDQAVDNSASKTNIGNIISKHS